jgi:uncharacterized protein YjbI with pentapeptide repeats
MTAGNERSGGRDSGAEKPQRPTPRSKWTAPFAWFEWGTEWIAYGLSRWALIPVLQSVTALTILWTAFSYLAGADERKQQRLDEIKQSHYQAWQAINTAQGQRGSGGRVEALEDLNGDNQSLVGLSAPYAFLQGIDLVGAELDNANLQEAHLNGANLREASLRNAVLRDADLGGSASDNTRKANLQEANLEGTDARGANLSGVYLRGATLNNADLNDAVLDKAQLQGATLKGVVLQNASLAGANLQGADLENANLWYADISGADLRGAKNLTQQQIDDALGDDETQLPEDLQASSTWVGKSQLSESGPLPPGEYSAAVFDAPMSFKLGEGWENVGYETDTFVELVLQDTDYLGIFFTAPKRIYDPQNLSTAKILPLPKDMVAWLRGHPYVHTADEPVEVDVGGVAGKQFDIQILTMPEDYPNELCENPCLPVFVNDPIGGALRLYQGGYRVIVLAVQGQTVVIFIDLAQGTPAKAEEVLKTLKWTGI